MCHAVLAVVSNCCPPLKGRFLTRYSPVRHCPLLHLDESSIRRFSFDLHVLSTPPAFVLSQDQTLHDRLFVSARFFLAFLTQILCGFFFFLKLAHRLFSRCTVQFSKNHRSKRLHYFSMNFASCQAFYYLSFLLIAGSSDRFLFRKGSTPSEKPSIQISRRGNWR